MKWGDNGYIIYILKTVSTDNIWIIEDLKYLKKVLNIKKKTRIFFTNWLTSSELLKDIILLYTIDKVIYLNCINNNFSKNI